LPKGLTNEIKSMFKQEGSSPSVTAESGKLRPTYFILERGGIGHTQKIGSGRYFSIMSPRPDYSRYMGKIQREET